MILNKTFTLKVIKMKKIIPFPIKKRQQKLREQARIKREKHWEKFFDWEQSQMEAEKLLEKEEIMARKEMMRNKERENDVQDNFLELTDQEWEALQKHIDNKSRQHGYKENKKL